MSAQDINSLRLKARQGLANAQYGLGVLYYNGDGVLINKSKAAYWIMAAYENNNPDISNKASDFWKENELWKYNE